MSFTAITQVFVTAFLGSLTAFWLVEEIKSTLHQKPEPPDEEPAQLPTPEPEPEPSPAVAKPRWEQELETIVRARW